jgi:7,8-dihydroneopterin aldolase/epimerase/oxygenase
LRDRIEIERLRLLGHHGANPGEQDRAQPFEVDLVVEGDFGRAVASDELEQAIDYGALVAAARRVVEGTRHRLLESLAGRLCEELLADPRVESVTVALRKMRPPLEADLASVGVRLRRSR